MNNFFLDECVQTFSFYFAHIHTHTHHRVALCSVSACLSVFPSPSSFSLSPLFVPLPSPALLFPPARSLLPACSLYFKPLLGRGRERQRGRGREGKADRIWSSSSRAENRLNRGESEQKGNQEKEWQGQETKHTVALFENSFSFEKEKGISLRT